MRYAAIFAGASMLLLATPAWADREFLTGFEECTLGSYNYDCGDGQPCIFTKISGTNVKIVTEAEAGDSFEARGAYCTHDSRNAVEDNRGMECAVNADCVPTGGSDGICTSHPGNDCWLEIYAPDAASSAQYVTVTNERTDSRTDVDMGSMTDAYLHFLFGVSGTIAADGGNIDVSGAFKTTDGNTHDSIGCRVEMQRISSTQYRLITKFGGNNGGSPNQDGKEYECSGGNASGNWCTPCDDDAECGRCITGDSTTPKGAVCTDNGDCGGVSPECAFGACENDGTTGSCNNECTRYTADEAFCTEGKFGSTPPLTVGRWYEIVLGDEYDSAGLHSCRLWEGGLDRGSVAVSEWRCVTSLLPCDSNADCGNRCDDYTLADDPTGAVTCADNDDCAGNCGTDICQGRTGVTVGPTVGFYLGNWRETAVQGPYRLHFDDVILDDEAADNILVTRVEDITVDADTGTENFQSDGGTSCGSATCYIEVNDQAGCASAACIDTANHLRQEADKTSDTQSEEQHFTLANLVTALGTDAAELATDAAVAITAVVSDDGNKAEDSDKHLKLCAADSSGANDSCGPTVDVSDHTSNAFVPDVYSIVRDAPAASATDWTRTNLNSARLEMKSGTAAEGVAGSCSANCRNHIASVVAQVDIEGDPTAVPGVAGDINTDGEIAICPIGDSTFDDLDSTLPGELEDFTTILDATSGSATIGDVDYQIASIMNGGVGGRMEAAVLRGVAGTPCDFPVFLIGVNSLVSGPSVNSYCNAGADVGAECTDNGDCTSPGTCEVYTSGRCRGREDDGQPCNCPRNDVWETGVRGTRYCANGKTGHWLEPNDTACDTCATNSDCKTEIPCDSNTDCGTGATCDTGNDCDGAGDRDGCCQTVCADAPGIGAVVGKCTFSIGEAVFKTGDLIKPPGSYLQPGCIDVPNCESGLCWAPNNLAAAEAGIEEILTKIEAMTNTGATCISEGDCLSRPIIATQPKTQSVNQTYFWAYSAKAQELEAYNSLLIQIAKRRGLNWVDLAERFERDCEPYEECFRDGVHWSCPVPSIGCLLAQGGFEDCLENKHGVSDGECASSVCTEGKVGRACANNGDCDTYYCDMAP